MSEYFFGLGKGWLPDKADEIAHRHGAALCNYTDAQCNCGHGCPPYTCEKSRRHWFACPNRGAPFDKATEHAVMAHLEQAGLTGGNG